jgi:hypothetical protein
MSTEIPGFPGLDELSLVDEDDGGQTAGEPAVFGEREAGSTHQGPERRKYHRRQQADRRNQVRFEPGKEERRYGVDRRKGSWKSNSTV